MNADRHSVAQSNAGPALFTDLRGFSSPAVMNLGRSLIGKVQARDIESNDRSFRARRTFVFAV